MVQDEREREVLVITPAHWDVKAEPRTWVCQGHWGWLSSPRAPPGVGPHSTTPGLATKHPEGRKQTMRFLCTELHIRSRVYGRKQEPNIKEGKGNGLTHFNSISIFEVWNKHAWILICHGNEERHSVIIFVLEASPLRICWWLCQNWSSHTHFNTVLTCLHSQLVTHFNLEWFLLQQIPKQIGYHNIRIGYCERQKNPIAWWILEAARPTRYFFPLESILAAFKNLHS